MTIGPHCSLGTNQIRDAGAVAIGEALKGNTFLQELQYVGTERPCLLVV